ncbi:MAG: ribulose-phosphate 3-epimerase, partial [Clostridia bacterium]|nr:ribulose-phosphate 3-epimerase [Clostridia bacterium]
AINPGTPVCMLESLTQFLDGVLCMTVNPGFTGQQLIPGIMDKIRAVRDFLDAHGLQNAHVEVDGHVTFENAAQMARAGADWLVGGTGSIFYKNGSIEENVKKSLAALEGV